MSKLLLVTLAMCVASCSLGDSISLDVVATVEDLVEFDDGFTKTGHVVVRLENRSVIPVYAYIMALSLETDKNTYYQTVRDDRGIPPEMTIWVTLQIPYFDSGEFSTVEGIEISDLYFE